MIYSMVPVPEDDEFLELLWEDVIRDGRLKLVFYDGGVMTVEDFIPFIRSPKRLCLLATKKDEEGIYPADYKVGLAWLDRFEQYSARLHFTIIGKYQRSIGEALVRFLLEKTKLKVVWGCTPESHVLALRVVRSLGFTLLGGIPNLCNLYYEDRLVPGVISYFNLEGGRNGRKR